MRVVYLTSEADPFIKTGGLADVMYALPQQVAKLGHDVSLFMPRYDICKNIDWSKMTKVDEIFLNGKLYNIFKLYMNNVKYYFVENQYYYERNHLYGDNDEDEQYANFCEVVLQYLRRSELQPDIVHCNDWQTAPFPYFLKVRYKHDPFFWDVRVVFTIHNLMYQGKFSNRSFKNLSYDINSSYINFMAIGLEYADIVNTVSPSYAVEIKYPYFAEGLEYITNSKQIYGILNGIDYSLYNPKFSKGIVPYVDSINEFKKANREKLLKEFNLSDDGSMIISLISRLVEGKGLDLVKARLEELLKYDNVKVIILGSGSKEYEDYFNMLAYNYPNKFKVYLGYNPILANLIYAGSDLFLMPSRYEPCGLSQLIAMRMGTIPLVRETGGLRDTVKPFNEYTGDGTGFSFTSFNADDMLNTIRYAENIFFNHHEQWKKLVKINFNYNSSWEKSTIEYLKLYALAKLTP